MDIDGRVYGLIAVVLIVIMVYFYTKKDYTSTSGMCTGCAPDTAPVHYVKPSHRHHRVKYGIPPKKDIEGLAEAERAAWSEAAEETSTGHYDVERGDSQSHTSQPVIDYNAMITGSIADHNMHSKHQNWVDEVKPFSRTLLKVDDLEEAVEQSQHRIGLVRYNLQPVETDNPLLLVEGSDLGGNNKTFRFMG